MPGNRVAGQVGLYVGGAYGWVDITADTRLANASSGGGISITRGRSAEGTQAEPPRATLTVNNKLGKYSPRNPSSIYYGLLGRATPVRGDVQRAADPFTRTVASGWGSTPDGLAWTTAGGNSGDYAVSGGLATMTHNSPINTLRRALLPRTYVDVDQVVDVQTSALLTGAALVTGTIARFTPAGDMYWLRCEFNPGGTTVMAKISRLVSGTWTDLAVLNPVPGLAYAANTTMRVRTSVVGSYLAIRIWPASSPEPRDWTLTATDDTLTSGKCGLQTWLVAGNTNTPAVVARFDSYQLLDPRYRGEVASWPVKWDVSGRDVWVDVEASGLMRRLGQGAKPLRSPLYRELIRSSPSAYWPLEDDAGALSARSAVDGVADMTTFGYSRFTVPGSGGTTPVPAANLPVFASGEGIPGAKTAVDLSKGGVLQARIPPPPAGTTTGWQIDFVMLSPRDKGAAVIPIRWITDGTWPNWELQIDNSGHLLSCWITLAGGTSGNCGVSDKPWDGLPHHYRIEAYQVSGNTYANIYIDGVYCNTVTDMSSGPMVGAPGAIVQVIINPLEYVNGTEAMPILGHVAVWNPYPASGPNTLQAMRGWAGETATTRMTRLATEDGIPLIIQGSTDDSIPVGPQGLDTWINLVREAATIDGGILTESRATPAALYRTRVSLYNQTPIPLSYSGGHLTVLEPVEDDQAIRNDVTVSRPAGGTARITLDSGPLSTQDPPDGVGVYDESLTLNVASDDELAPQAGWRVHLGTADEARYPRLTADLTTPAWTADPDLAARATAADSGTLLSVDGLPTWLPPGPTTQLVQGYTETLDGHTWTIQWVTTPGSLWLIATADGDTRAPADGSALNADITAAATSLQIASTTANGPWVTGDTVSNPTDFPLSVRVGAERVTVTAITGAASPQTFTAVRAVNGVSRAWPAGTQVDVWDPAISPL